MRLWCFGFLVVSVCFLGGCGGGSPTTPVNPGPPTEKVETKKKGQNLIKEELPPG